MVSKFSLGRTRINAIAITAMLALAPVAAFATGTPGDGTLAGQTYGLGAGGSPDGAGWQGLAQGFNSSSAPYLVSLLPVFVVIMAIWMGPRILKRLMHSAVNS